MRSSHIQRTGPAILLSVGLVVSVVTPVSVVGQEPKPASQPSSKRSTWSGALSEDEFAALHELKKDKPPQLHGKMIDVAGAKGYLSMPKGQKPTAGVLVIHEWWGLNDHIKHCADRLAAEGYAALAIDLYGGAVATTPQEARAAMGDVDDDKALTTLQAALFFMRGPQVNVTRRACIGWCFGGGWSLKLAMAAPDLDAAVIYYGRLVDDKAKLAAIRAPVLGVFGSQDRSIPPERIDAFEKAMKAAGKDITIRRYDANHAFANPSSARYDKANAAAAWQETRAFLDRHLADPRRRGSFKVADQNVGYLVPKGWQRAKERPMRQVNLTVADGVECYVTVLPGEAGGVAANLNRWREQMGSTALSEDEIGQLPRLEMAGRKAHLLVVDGTYTDMRGEATDDARMMAVVCPLKGATVFVKMLGPRKLVAGQDAAFRAFCRSMK